jgi:hypothetical protein
MAFLQRQIAEIYPLVEISFCALTPGAVGAGSTVNVPAAACTLGNTGTGVPATFAIGDQLEIWATAAAATNGIIVSAAPSATPGTCTVSFFNPTAGSITPVAGAKYQILALRTAANIVS